MNKRLGYICLRIGSIWNIITGSITLFYYSSWLQKNVFIEKEVNLGALLADRYFFQNIYLFVIGYGLIFILIGTVNIILSTKILKNPVSLRILIWLSIWTLASYFTVDIIGFIFYFVTIIIFILNYMSLKIAKNS